MIKFPLPKIRLGFVAIVALVLAGALTFRPSTPDLPSLPSGAGTGKPPVMVDLRALPFSIQEGARNWRPRGHVLGEDEHRRLKQETSTRPLPVVPDQLAVPHPGFNAVSPKAPALLAGFQAIADTGEGAPDAAIAVGATQVLVVVNASFAVFDKSGTPLYGPRTLSDFYAPLGLPASTAYFDPRAAYDSNSGRWFMLTAAWYDYQSWLMVSVSRSSDATGTWDIYALDATLNGSTSTSYWADYPTLGIDSQAVYLTANMFDRSPSPQFQYSKVRILDKSQLILRLSPSWRDFWDLRNGDGTRAATIQPAVTFGNPGVQYLVNAAGGNGNFVTLWSITNPLSASPGIISRTVSVPTFYIPSDIEQLGTSTRLGIGGSHLMNAVYRNGSVWTTQTTTANFGSGNVAAVAYYEIQTSSGTARQAKVFGVDGLHHFQPSIMVDQYGNAGILFNRSGPSEHISARYTGRLSSDPLGTLQADALLKAGAAEFARADQFGNYRWGDYTALALDPDGKTFWMLSEYVSSGDSWGTWVGSAAYPSSATPTPTYSPTPAPTVAPSPTSTYTPTPSPTASVSPTATPTGAASTFYAYLPVVLSRSSGSW